MKINKLFSFISLLLVYAVSLHANADYACSFDLRMGVAVSRDHIRLLDADRTVVQINRSRQLFVRGKLKKLDQEQQDLLYSYARGIHDVVPEITLLAKEGVGLVTDNITRIYSGLVGRDSDSTEKLYASMKRVKETVKEKFGRSNHYYFINPGKLEHEDDDIPPSLQAQITSGFTNVSGIITAIGTFDSTGDSDNTSELRKRARATCNKLYRLNKIEGELLAKVDELAWYDVIVDNQVE